MARATRRRSNPTYVTNERPVRRIDLSGEHLGLRFALFALAVLVAVVCIWQALAAYFHPEAGWQVVSVSQKAPSAAPELTLYAKLDGTRQEHARVTEAYQRLTREAYELFHETDAFAGVNNLACLNRHPNETVELPAALYRALERVADNRALYLAPVYAECRSLCYSEEDYAASQVDPLLDADARAYHEAVMAYAADPSAVSVELLGDNRACLRVSAAYAAFARESDIAAYVDFGWLKNAFVVDFVADGLSEAGFMAFALCSYDGFARCHPAPEGGLSFTLHAREGDRLIPAAEARCDAAATLVRLRDFPAVQEDAGRYYVYQNGERRVPYLDPADGLGKAALPCLLAASATEDCAGVALRVAPLYVADEWDAEAALALADGDALALLYSADGRALTQTPNTLLSCAEAP